MPPTLCHQLARQIRRYNIKMYHYALPCWLWNDLLPVTFVMKYTQSETFL